MTEAIRPVLERAQASLDAAIACASTNPGAAMDDLLAARLLLATLLTVQPGL